MKKIFTALTAVIILLSSLSLAEGLPAQSAEAPDLPAFATISEARSASDGHTSICTNANYHILVLESRGRRFRVISALDSHAKELYSAAWDASENSSDHSLFDPFYAYAESLPVCSIEEFAEIPLTQEELDALNGKTIGEIVDGNRRYVSPYIGDSPFSHDCVELDIGLYSYRFDAGEGHEKYMESHDDDDLMNVIVTNGEYIGFSGDALSPDLDADGLLRTEGVSLPEEAP